MSRRIGTVRLSCKGRTVALAFAGATAWEWQVGRLYGRVGFPRYWPSWIRTAKSVVPPRDLLDIGWDREDIS